MPNPQQLKERIYALNPELKELSFGCEVMTDDGVRKLISDGCLSSGFSKYQYTIGHPIHLEHLLFAIKDVAIIKLYSDGLEIVANHLAVMYDLTKTFDQNIAENEELVTFLLSIIKE